MAVGGDQIGAHAPGIYLGSLGLQAVDQVLVQIAGGGDNGVLKTGVSQHLVGLFGEVGKVTAVNADTVAFQLYALLLHFLKYTDGIGHAGIQHVIGIHQQNAGVGVLFCVCLKRGVLVRETHDPAMGMGSFYGHVEHLTGQHIGSSDTAADHSGSGAVDPRVRALSAAQAEFHDSVPFGSIYHPGGLCGDQALVVQNVQQSCLNKLGLHNRGNDLHKRFPWEDYGPLRNGVDITCKMEAPQVFQEICVEDLQRFQVVDVIRGEVEVANIFDNLFKSGSNGVSSVTRIFSVKGIKNDYLVSRVLKITLHHGQLI